MATSSSPLDLYESMEVIGTGSFGIIRKVRRKVDGAVSGPLYAKSPMKSCLILIDHGVQRT